MAQTFTSTEVTTTTNVFGDNQSQRTNENTLRSNFSGATQPSDPVVGQHWYDTGNNKEWQYNGSAWVPIDTNSTTQVDVSNAKGSLTNLTSYLRVAHNDDGTLKTSPATAIDEFKDNALVITYVSPTSFTVPTDLTSIFTDNRKLKIYLESSTVISYVVSSSYNSGTNVTTVVMGDAVLDSSVTSVKYSIIQYGEREDTVHDADLSTYAPLASPAFTGTPTAPTVNAGDSSTKLATTAFVTTALGNTGTIQENNIAAGRKITSTSGLGVTVSSGTDVINNTLVNFTENTITLPARKACILYDKSDGTSGYVEGVYPTAVGSTVYRWIINGTSSVVSTVGTNNLTSTGTITQSDGWLGYSAVGAGGHYAGTSSTSIPAYSSAFTCRILVNFVSNSAAQCFYHDGPRKIACNSSNYLLIGGVSTGFVMTSGNTYVIEVKGAGNTTAGTCFINGVPVYTGAIVVNTAGTVPYVLSNNSSGELSVSGVEYVELFSSSISNDNTGSVSNQMILPCFYTNSSTVRRSIISDVTPSGSVIIAYARTNGTSVLAYNDLWPMYGRREGATGGNRKMFLGWLPFSGASVVQWENPFGSRKLKLHPMWAQDNQGTNESDCSAYYNNTTYYGVGLYREGGSIPTQSASSRIALGIGASGATYFNGAWKTSGYIGVYAEMLEDYTGVV